MKKRTRIISLLLCLTLLFGVMPISTLAVGAEGGFANFTRRNEFSSNTFEDVTSDAWCFENVKAAYQLGLMIGDSPTTFNPDGDVKISETITIAARLHSIFTYGKEEFEASDPWYDTYVDYALTHGIIKSEYSDYSAHATRAEFAYILASALPASALEAVNKVADGRIPDIDTNAYYAEAVYMLYRAGVIIGNDTIGTFLPESNISRGEVAAIASRMAVPSLRKDIQLGEDYIVTFDTNGGSSKTTEQVVFEGELATQPKDPSNGMFYTFEGWFTAPTGGTKFDFNTPIHSDITLYAHWDFNEALYYWWMSQWNKPDDTYYTVTFDANGSDVENLPAAQQVNAGECAVEPAEPTKEGYAFLGWILSSDGVVKFDFSTPINQNITLYALWANKSGDIDTTYIVDESHFKYDVQENIVFVDNVILAFTKDNLTESEKERIAESVNGVVVGSLEKVSNILQIRVAASNFAELKTLCGIANGDENVFYATYDVPTYDLSTTGNYKYSDSDPWGDSFFHPNVWDEVLVPDGYNWGWEAIKAYGTWNTFSEFFNGVNVGVVDTGFDLNHEDLKGKIHFLNDLGDNDESVPHGTSVAGIIGAANNSVGMCGVAYNADLICSDYDDCKTAIGIFAIFDEILDNNANIINLSLGRYFFDQDNYRKSSIYEDGMTYNEYVQTTYNISISNGQLCANYIANLIKNERDHLFIQASGNGVNNEYSVPVNAFANGMFASCTEEIVDEVESTYGLTEGTIKSHFIIVTSIENTQNDSGNYNLVSGANRGDTVDVCAPGDEIYTTAKGNSYDTDFGGTSAATPFVSGAAALVWSINPNLTASQVKEILLEGSSTNGVGIFYDIFDEGAEIERVSYPLINVHNSAWIAYNMLKDEEAVCDITLNFIDTDTNSNLTCNEVTYTVNSLTNGYYDDIGIEKTLSLIHRIFTDGSSNNYSTASVTLPHGLYDITFSASGYQDKVFDWTNINDVEFTVDENTTEITIYMTPEGSAIPPGGNSYTVSGRLVSASDGSPIANMEVELNTNSNIHIDNINSYSTTTDSNGYFSFQNVEVQTDYILRSGDGVNYQYYQIDSLSVTQDIDLDTIQLIPVNKTATLLSGKEFNAAVKSLIAETIVAYSEKDSNVEYIEFTNKIPFGASTSVDVSDANSATIITAYWNESTKTLSIYSDATEVLLNSDSSYMFYNFTVLKGIDLGISDSSEVTNMISMFVTYSPLSTVKVSENFSFQGSVSNSAQYAVLPTLTEFSSGSILFGLCDDGTQYTGMWKINDDPTLYSATEITEQDRGIQAVYVADSYLTAILVYNFQETIAELAGGKNQIVSIRTSNVQPSDSFENCIVSSSSRSADITAYWNSEEKSIILYSLAEKLYINYGKETFMNFSALEEIDMEKIYVNTTNTQSMFAGCTSLKSVDLTNFNTSNVTFMHRMFQNCSSLTALDLSSFDTSKVETMYEMFEGCTSLASINLSSFDTSYVISMSGMFYACDSLVSVDLSHFNFTNACDLRDMFTGCDKLETVKLGFIDNDSVELTYGQGHHYSCDGVKRISSMFDHCTALKTVDFNRMNTKDFVEFSGLFSTCPNLQNIIWGDFKTTNAQSMTRMFYGCVSLKEVDLSIFETDNVTSMSEMFSACKSLMKLDLSSFNTQNVEIMTDMFNSNESLESITFGENFSTSNVTSMYCMFSNCKNLEVLDLKSFDTSSVKGMAGMFALCESLISLDIDHFETNNVTSMEAMFSGCSNLETLNIAGFDTKNTNVSNMFIGCYKLTSVTVGSNFSFKGNGSSYAYLPIPEEHEETSNYTGKWISSSDGKAYSPEEITNNDFYVNTTYTAEILNP